MAPPTSPLRLVQFLDEDGARWVAKVDEGGKQLQVLADTTRISDLVLEAGRTGVTLDEIVASRLGRLRFHHRDSTPATTSRSS